MLTLLCEVFNAPLMRLFGASDQIIDMAVEYFAIIAACFPLYLLLNVMNSMIRADGSPTFAMIAMLIGAVINIVLDPLFIFVFKWGIAGAAWATGIGQLASFVMCAVYFSKPKSFRLTRRSFIPDAGILRSTILLGAATFVTQISIVIMSLTSNIILTKYGALSIYGQDIPISVFSIQTKVYTLVQNIVTGVVLGGQPIFGYNYGAGKLKRVRETYRLVLLSTLVVSDINTNSPSILHELYLSTRVIQQAVAAQEMIIRRIAENGSCVIVGRAADWVLRDHPNVVRVFIHAPREFRIQSIMERYGDSREDAISNVRHSDEARAAYYRSISGQDWGDPHFYELCVDASARRETCAETIIRFVQKKENQ